MEDLMELATQRAPSHRKGARLTKRLANLRGASRRGGARLTKAGGWVAIAFGAAHVVVAPLESRSREVWSQAASEGWWNTFTLDESTTLAQFERSETFWVTLGSFGVPVLVLGSYVVWSTYQRHRVPAWVGWILLAWGLVTVSALPDSPAWALALSGALIALGDRPRNRATP
jgi:Family of unknown function (DUF6463)